MFVFGTEFQLDKFIINVKIISFVEHEYLILCFYSYFVQSIHFEFSLFRVFLHHQSLILMATEIRGNFVQISIILFCKFRVITLMDLLLFFP
jgi:hypothetical protein